MSTLQRAISIAVEAHAGQVDKSGRPYILHPLRMMLRQLGDEAMMAAVLHDVVEDTPWTFEDLRREGFSETVLVALACLTKREGEAYEDFIERAAANPIARTVKLADLEDNMDVRRLRQVSESDRARLDKYRRAWERLQRS